MKMRISGLWYVSAAVLFCLLVLFRIPAVRTIRQNDSAAVGRLRRIGEAQLDYAAHHPEKGFACRLSDLSVINPYSGYRFVLACDPARNGVVEKYQLSAEPLEVGKTGKRTYCLTDVGVIWYDKGSSANCFSAHQVLEQ
jgi:hypothetical protein